MKKQIFVLMLAASSSGVWGEWVKLTESNTAISYIDPSTIRRVGNHRRVWVLQDLKQKGPLGAMSMRALEEYDCQEERRRFLSSTSFSGPMLQGEVLTTSDTTTAWHNVGPGSVAEGFLKFVCTR